MARRAKRRGGDGGGCRGGGWREAAGRAVCLGRMYDMRVDSSDANRHASFTSREYLTTALRASNATDAARAFATTGRA